MNEFAERARARLSVELLEPGSRRAPPRALMHFQQSYKLPHSSVVLCLLKTSFRLTDSPSFDTSFR